MTNTVEYTASFVYNLQILFPCQLVMLQALSVVKVDTVIPGPQGAFFPRKNVT